MNAVIQWLIKLSVQTCALVLCVMIVRLAFANRLSARTKYALWLIPAARLALPFDIGFQSDFSLMGALEALSLAPAADTIAVNHVPVPTAVNAVSAASTAPVLNAAAQATASAQPVVRALSSSELILLIWLLGVALSLGYAVLVNIRFFAVARCEREYLCKKGDLSVYMLKGIASPCLLGVIKPCILVNDTAVRDCGTLCFAVWHEEAHYNQKDNIWALVRSLICCVYWFNPLVWLAAAISRRDCELACDERVMRNLDYAERERYGMALISLMADTPEQRISAFSASTAMTGSKRALKARIERIASKSRFSKAATAVALTLLFMLSAFACAASKPAQAAQDDFAAPVTTDAPSGTAEPKTDAEPENNVVASYPTLELVYENGSSMLYAGEANAELAKLMEKCIFDSLVLSAAWPRVDINDYKPYIVLTQELTTSSGVERHKYYAFVMNGTPCLQGDSMYTVLLRDNFEALLKAFDDANTLVADGARSQMLDGIAKLRALAQGKPLFDTSAYTKTNGEAVAEQAKLLIGEEYGGSGQDGFDMSGLVYYALNQAGVAIDRQSPKGYKELGWQEINGINDLMPGDITLFAFSEANTATDRINGCAVYVGDGNMVIASSAANEVRLQSLTDSKYFSKHFVCAMRFWQ